MFANTALVFPYRFMREHSLLQLDVSGNDELGNVGCLKLLQHCHGSVKVILASCGLSSPLPNGLVKILSELRAKHLVDIVGNNIDSADYAQIYEADQK